MGKSKKKSKGKSGVQTEQTTVQTQDFSGNEAMPQNDLSDMQVDEAQTHSSKDSRQFNKGHEEASNAVTQKGSAKNYENSKIRDSGSSYNKSRDFDNRTRNERPGDNASSRRSEPYKRSKQYEDQDRRENKRFSVDSRDSRNRTPRDSSYSRRNVRSGFYQDSEFKAYENEFRSHKGDIEYKKTREIVSNLFLMSDDYSLAHCVAEDMNMGSGIAVQFRRDFRQVDKLLNQRQKTGGLAILKDKNRYIYYLVTKQYSFGKPTNASLFASLKQLRNHVVENQVKKIAMPRIGCGLDRLEWDEVMFMIEFIFQEVEVEIVVCNLEMTEDSPQQKFRNCKVVHEKYPIQDIENGTIILYFSSEDGFVSDEMKKLDDKFQFLREFRHARKVLGDVVFYSRNENYLLCGCIVRKNESDSFNFEALQKCLPTIQKENKRFRSGYIAFQVFRDVDPMINYKIINVLRNSLRDIEVYVCWPGDLQDLMASKDRFDDYSPARGSRTDKDWGPSQYKSPGKDNWRSTPSSYQQKNQGTQEIMPEIDHWNNPPSENQQKSVRSAMSTPSMNPEAKEFHYNSNPSSENKQNIFFKGGKSNQEMNPEASEHQDESTYENQQNDSFVSVETSASDWTDSGDQTPAKFTRQDVSTINQMESIKLDSQKHIASADNLKENASYLPHEYEKFENAIKNNSIKQSIKEHQNGSNLPPKRSRVCFAGEDLIIESGVPPGPDISQYICKLLAQNVKQGGVAFVKEDSYNFLYCLIIKKGRENPTPKSIFSAIKELQDHVKKNSVRTLVIPKMEQDWPKITSLFNFLLGTSNVDMISAPFDAVCTAASLEKKNKIKFTHSRKALFQMKPKSAVIYLASADGHITQEMTRLDKKFKFLNAFRKQKRVVAEVVTHKENEDVVCGCIVKRCETDPIDFEAFGKCMAEVNKQIKAEKLENVGIQALSEPETINDKILTVLLHHLKEVTLLMCWSGDLKHKMPANRS